MEDKIVMLTPEDKEKLLSKSAYVLPNNPSGKHFSADQIKRKLYEPSLVLFEHILKFQQETKNEIDYLSKTNRFFQVVNNLKDIDVKTCDPYTIVYVTSEGKFYRKVALPPIFIFKEIYVGYDVPYLSSVSSWKYIFRFDPNSSRPMLPTNPTTTYLEVNRTYFVSELSLPAVAGVCEEINEKNCLLVFTEINNALTLRIIGNKSYYFEENTAMLFGIVGGETTLNKEEIENIVANITETTDWLKEYTDAETERATDAETILDDKIDAETERATDAETILDDKIDVTLVTAKQYADGLVSKAYKTMGSVNTYADLPSNPNNGDVYNILKADEEHGIQAGENVVWNGTKWDELGGVFDTSKIDNEIYQLKKDVKYLSTAGIISATYDDNAGLMEFVLSDGANALYNYDTGYITVVYE